MTRYTINIGDDFPLGDDDRPGNGHHHGPGRRGFGLRIGTVLRVLFILSIAAIVLSHPVKTAIVVGLILLFRRSPWVAELRGRAMAQLGRSGDWTRWQDAWRERCGARGQRHAVRPDPRREDQRGEGRYRGFV